MDRRSRSLLASELVTHRHAIGPRIGVGRHGQVAEGWPEWRGRLLLVLVEDVANPEGDVCFHRSDGKVRRDQARIDPVRFLDHAEIGVGPDIRIDRLRVGIDEEGVGMGDVDLSVEGTPIPLDKAYVGVQARRELRSVDEAPVLLHVDAGIDEFEILAVQIAGGAGDTQPGGW